MKKLVVIVLVLCLCQSVFGAVYSKMLNGENSFVIDNPVANVVRFNSGSEDLKATFSSNAVTWSSTTGVVTMDFGTVVPKTASLKVGAVTYTLPSTDGTSGYVLSTNGSGVTSWAAGTFNGTYNGTVAIDGGTGGVTMKATGGTMAVGGSGTGTVTIGGGTNAVVVSSSAWGVTSTGKITGLCNISGSTTTPVGVTAANSGTVYVDNGIATPADMVFTLPAAAAGLTYTFVDNAPTADDDLWITAASGDTINGGTAGKSYKCTGDAVKQFVTLVAIDDTQWVVIAESGTWENDNN